MPVSLSRRRLSKDGKPWQAGSLGRALLIMHLALSPLVFWTRLMEEFEFVKVAWLLLVVILLTALALTNGVSTLTAGGQPNRWRLAVQQKCRRLLGDPLALGVLCFTGSAVLSTLFSLSPRMSFAGDQDSYGGLVTILGYAVLFFATRAFCAQPAAGRWLLGATLGATAFSAVYALLQIVRLDPFTWLRWDVQYRPGATLGNGNFLAGYLAMTFPVLVYFCFRAAQRRQWLVLLGIGLTALLGCVALFATLCRGGWLAMACGILVFLGAWCWRKKSGRAMLAAAACFALLFAVTLLVLRDVSPAWKQALQSALERVRHFTESPPRQAVWAGGLRLFQNYPVCGSGLDTFRMAFPRVQGTEYWQREWGGQPTRAHNELIHILATQGILGLGAVLLLLAGIGIAAGRAWRQAMDRDRPLVVALVAGLVAFAVQDFFCFTVCGCGTLFVTLTAVLSCLAQPGPEQPPIEAPVDSRPFVLGLLGAGLLLALLYCRNCLACSIPLSCCLLLGCLGMVLAFVLAGWCLARLHGNNGTTGDHPSEQPLPKHTAKQPGWTTGSFLLRGVIWGGAVILILQGVLPALWASAACRRGMEKLMAEPGTAIPDLEEAVRLAPWNDIYPMQLGIAHLTLARGTSLQEAKSQSLQRAREALNQAVLREPGRGCHRIWLARVLTELTLQGSATAEQVLAQFDVALQWESKNAYYYCDACTAALTLRNWTRANQFALAGAQLYPHFAPPRAQLGHIALLEKRYEIAVDHFQQAMGLVWYDRVDEGTVARVSLTEALVKARRFEEAVAVGHAAVRDLPNHPAVHFYLALALAKLGQREEAQSEYRHFLALSPARGGEETSEPRLP